MEQKQKGGNSQPLNWLKNKRLQEDTGGIGNGSPVVIIDDMPDPKSYEVSPEEYKKQYEKFERERGGNYGTN